MSSRSIYKLLQMAGVGGLTCRLPTEEERGDVPPSVSALGCPSVLASVSRSLCFVFVFCMSVSFVNFVV